MWRKGNPLTLLGMQTSTATMENNVEISLKTGLRINRSCSSKFPFLLQGHHRTIVFLLQGKKGGVNYVTDILPQNWKSLFYSPTGDSNNEKFCKKTRKFQKYLHARVCHLCNFSTFISLTESINAKFHRNMYFQAK